MNYSIHREYYTAICLENIGDKAKALAIYKSIKNTDDPEISGDDILKRIASIEEYLANNIIIFSDKEYSIKYFLRSIHLNQLAQ